MSSCIAFQARSSRCMVRGKRRADLGRRMYLLDRPLCRSSFRSRRGRTGLKCRHVPCVSCSTIGGIAWIGGCGCTRKTEEYGNRPLRSCLQLSYGIETHRLPCSDVSCDGSERYAWPSVEVHVHLEKSRRFSTGRFVHTGWHEFTRTLTDLPTLLDSLISRYGSCRATQELRGRCGCIRLALRHRRLELGVRPVEPSGTLHSGWRLLTAGHPRSRFACGPEMEAGSGGVVRCPSTSGSRWSRITPATTRRRVPGKVCGAACGTLPSANRLIACASLHPARPIPADLRPQP